jgi:hypothetical protein
MSRFGSFCLHPPSRTEVFLIMDTRVQNSVIAHLGRRPQTVDTGAFRIGWDIGTDSRFINYATPHLGTTPTPIDVAELVAAFREIGRVPRLEYVVSCAPDLDAPARRRLHRRGPTCVPDLLARLVGRADRARGS